MEKVLVAMSGGVDSAVTAALLLQQGYCVSGATMVQHEYADTEAADAARSAKALGIPFEVFDWQTEFTRLVRQPFLEVYRSGGTPNPCVLCNKTVKFGLFLEKALELGFDYVATGHYARIGTENGRRLVRTAMDTGKDQTYMLYSLSQHQLRHVLLPMGGMTKQEARLLAGTLGLPAASKHDSQDICFIPDGDYMESLLKSGLTPQQGRFLDMDGRDLGPHRGFEAYTIGQRRGLDIAYGSRIYVVEKPAPDVRVGPSEALMASRVLLKDVNWIPFDTLREPIRACGKLRYTPKSSPCTVYPHPDGAELVFDEPQRAVTPGQAAVLYQDDLLLGGGTIVRAF